MLKRPHIIEEVIERIVEDLIAIERHLACFPIALYLEIAFGFVIGYRFLREPAVVVEIWLLIVFLFLLEDVAWIEKFKGDRSLAFDLFGGRQRIDANAGSFSIRYAFPFKYGVELDSIVGLFGAPDKIFQIIGWAVLRKPGFGGSGVFFERRREVNLHTGRRSGYLVGDEP